MKFTYNWLKEHLETSASVSQIVECLNAIGLEVEDVKDPQQIYKDFTVAQIVKVKRHENADKLWHCHVCIAENEAPVEIVCGAPNVRVGLKVVFAKPKTYIPGRDMTIEKATIRGIESYGMLCSEMELLISNEHDGIIELSEDAIIGHPCHTYLGFDDVLIEVAITPNRGDCLGVYGIARELAAAGLGTLRAINFTQYKGDFECPITVALDFHGKDIPACSAFAGRLIKGVKNCESPLWLQKRLQNIGLRPISALVDITNYITYDMCRPLHVFDTNKLTQNLCARYARKGEKFEALDNKCYEADIHDCVIADDSGMLALAGVIGGVSSSTEMDTQNVFIESALFEPAIIAKTARRLGIMSDARQRFERGVDKNSVILGIEMATALIIDICGGSPSTIVHAVHKNLPSVQVLEFPLSEIERLSGISISEPIVKNILEQLGFDIKDSQDGIYIINVPSHRYDIAGKADIVEEIIRIYGLEKIPSLPLPRLPYICKPLLTTEQKTIQTTRRLVAARGFVEMMSWSFIKHEDALRFGHKHDALKLKNPISTAMTTMRPSLLPGLIAASAHNERHGHKDFALFELGQCFHSLDNNGQTLRVAGVRTGSACYMQQSRQWYQSERNVSYIEAKEDVYAILLALGLNKNSLKVIDSSESWFHPGYSGQVGLGVKNIIAHFGMLHPKYINHYDIKQPLSIFEIMLSDLPVKRNKNLRSGLDEPITHNIYRDLAFVVDENIPAGEVLESLLRADKKHVKDIKLFDVYQGKGLADNEKSLAFEIILMPPTPNPEEEWIGNILQTIIRTAEKYCQARLRQ